MRGLIIGKFYPPHCGHEYLIRFARERVDELHVFVFYRSDETIDGNLRAQWLRELFPNVIVHAQFAEHRDPYNPRDEQGWSAWIDEIRRTCALKFDFVFSSEAYGDELARRLNAEHVIVDLQRVVVPISGTRVRENPRACLEFISPRVRAYYSACATTPNAPVCANFPSTYNSS